MSYKRYPNIEEAFSTFEMKGKLGILEEAEANNVSEKDRIKSQIALTETTNFIKKSLYGKYLNEASTAVHNIVRDQIIQESLLGFGEPDYVQNGLDAVGNAASGVTNKVSEYGSLAGDKLSQAAGASKDLINAGIGKGVAAYNSASDAVNSGIDKADRFAKDSSYAGNTLLGKSTNMDHVNAAGRAAGSLVQNGLQTMANNPGTTAGTVAGLGAAGLIANKVRRR